MACHGPAGKGNQSLGAPDLDQLVAGDWRPVGEARGQAGERWLVPGREAEAAGQVRDRLVLRGERVQDPVVKAFWVDEFSKYTDKFMVEAISPIQNKVGQFLSTSLIRNIISNKKLKTMNNNKGLLIAGSIIAVVIIGCIVIHQQNQIQQLRRGR